MFKTAGSFLTGVMLIALCVGAVPSYAETVYSPTAENGVRMQWADITAADLLKSLAEKNNKKVESSAAVQGQKLAPGAIEADSLNDLFVGVMEHADYTITGEGGAEIYIVTSLRDFPLAAEVDAMSQDGQGMTDNNASPTSTSKSVSVGKTGSYETPVMPQVPSDLNGTKAEQNLDQLQRERGAQQNAVFLNYANGGGNSASSTGDASDTEK